MDKPVITPESRSEAPQPAPLSRPAKTAATRDGQRADLGQLNQIAERWREYRTLYAIYAELARIFKLGPPCAYLETPVDRTDPEILKAVDDWFATVDERLEAWHLRQLLQTTSLGSESNLRALLAHYLHKIEKTAADRDRIDFLLVQYLDQCAPHSLQNGFLELEDVAFVLEPVLGEASTLQPAWLAPLDDVVGELPACRSLRDLLARGALDRVRAMKDKAGQMYFGSGALLAFARFNFLMRRTFFRLLLEDLRAIRRVLQELERLGVASVDCTRAQLSAEEPLENLRQICVDWKQPFRAPYTAGHSFQQLVEIRASVEAALATTRWTAAPPVAESASSISAPEKIQ